MAATIKRQKKALVLSKQEYTTLYNTGTLSKDGITYTYDPDIEYRVIGHYPDGDEIARDYQAKLVSGTNIKTVNGASLLGSGDIEVQSKTSKVIITDGAEPVALADNTEYSGTSLTDITFTYPQDDFECYLILNFADSGTITVTFPTSSYIGNAPTFANGETWEISIKNGVIVAGKVESNA